MYIVVSLLVIGLVLVLAHNAIAATGPTAR